VLVVLFAAGKKKEKDGWPHCSREKKKKKGRRKTRHPRPSPLENGRSFPLRGTQEEKISTSIIQEKERGERKTPYPSQCKEEETAPEYRKRTHTSFLKKGGERSNKASAYSQ